MAVHIASAQISTSAPVTPAGSSHRSVGLPPVTYRVERGAIGRTGITLQPPLPFGSNPGMHTKSHAPAAHTGVAFGGGEHSVHVAPQRPTSSSGAHSAPHR